MPPAPLFGSELAGTVAGVLYDPDRHNGRTVACYLLEGRRVEGVCRGHYPPRTPDPIIVIDGPSGRMRFRQSALSDIVVAGEPPQPAPPTQWCPTCELQRSKALFGPLDPMCLPCREA